MLFLSVSATLAGQDGPLRTQVYDSQIRTLRCHLVGLDLSLPIHTLNSRDIIRFSFDDLDRDVQDYFYTIVHCNADWTRSDLPTSEYLEGFESNPITNYDYSYATTQEYTHYEVAIPNQDVRPTKSGNYALLVYRYGNPDDPLIVQRFYVVDRKVSIEGQAKQSSRIPYRQTHQEVDFTIIHKNFEISNAFESVNVAIMQNGREDNMKTDIKPTFVQNEQLVYDYSEETSFQALKEFRWVDIQSLILIEERIKFTQEISGYPHAYVAVDPIRSYETYLYRKDINGRYFIGVREQEEDWLTADYVEVHFTLPFNNALHIGDLYIMGGFNQWQCTSDNKMTYNYERQAYEGTLLLKQGYYNYLYGFLESSADEVIDFDLVEGNYFDTENDYTIFIYHRSFGSRYDELIGVKTINSLGN